MLWLGVIAIGLLIVIACIVVTRSRSRRIGGHTAASPPAPPSFRVRAGAFDELATSILGPGTTVPEVERGDGRVAPLTEVTPLRAGRDSSNSSSGAAQDRKGRRAEALRDAAFIALPSELLAAAAGAETVHDVLAMDSTVLRSLHQLSGEQVSGLADLRDLQNSRHYDLLSFKVRGGAGEQAVAD
ncbi:hypothetical protein [Geodermatophilus saharensis]|uniref:hypothetical protein n=1 Tax=Geodermatophilus saharensis TaxID=1137994 RepID=UPI000B77491B|nr:hypothetical protein [Geodermatophilus saharensis]